MRERLLAAALIALVPAVTTIAPEQEHQQEPDGCMGPQDPFCSGGGALACWTIIGGGLCIGDSWSSTCWNGDPEPGMAQCYATTACFDSNGEVTGSVECEGDYSSQSDGSGVVCRDTGSDPGTSVYCP